MTDIIDAGSGWFSLHLTGSDRSGHYGVARTPISGWVTKPPFEWEVEPPDLRDAVHCLGWPVLAGSATGTTGLVVLSPDGRVWAGGVVHDSEDEWVRQAADERAMSLKEYAQADAIAEGAPPSTPR